MSAANSTMRTTVPDIIAHPQRASNTCVPDALYDRFATDNKFDKLEFNIKENDEVPSPLATRLAA
jgi:hypothetical protein